MCFLEPKRRHISIILKAKTSERENILGTRKEKANKQANRRGEKEDEEKTKEKKKKDHQISA